MNQATRTHNHGVSGDDYGAILGHARHFAKVNRPDIQVKAVERIGGRWWAVTDAGHMTLDDLRRTDVTLTGSHDYAG